MKKISVLAITALLTAISCTLYAQQNPDPKVMVTTTRYLDRTPENISYNLDSLLKIWKEKVMDANPYFMNSRIVTHYWGHDSRQVVFMYELKSWDDFPKADQRRHQIMKTHEGWATEEEFKAYRKIMGNLFLHPEHHSDEIYQVAAE